MRRLGLFIMNAYLFLAGIHLFACVVGVVLTFVLKDGDMLRISALGFVFNLLYTCPVIELRDKLKGTDFRAGRDLGVLAVSLLRSLMITVFGCCVMLCFDAFKDGSHIVEGIFCILIGIAALLASYALSRLKKKLSGKNGAED